MNETIQTILERRTIRKYRSEQLSEEALETILEAGLFAPNAGSRQACKIVVCQDAGLNDMMGKLNRNLIKDWPTPPSGVFNTSTKEQPSIADDRSIKSAFYGAPTVLTLFAPRNFNQTGDCFVTAQNIMLAAHSLGVGSCLVARAAETFALEGGQKLQKEWGLDQDYEAKIHITLGYPDGDRPPAKPRKNDRIIKVK